MLFRSQEIIDECYQDAKKTLEDNKDKLIELSNYLLEKETITGAEFMEVLNKEKPEQIEDSNEIEDNKEIDDNKQIEETVESPEGEAELTEEVEVNDDEG